MTNPIGVISMFYARPFTVEHFPTLARMKRAGADCIELLVPEVGELDLAEARAAIADAGLSVVLAARVNPTRDLASSDPAAHLAGLSYLETCVQRAFSDGPAEERAQKIAEILALFDWENGKPAR